MFTNVTLTSRAGDRAFRSLWMLCCALKSAGFALVAGLLVFRRQSVRFASMA